MHTNITILHLNFHYVMPFTKVLGHFPMVNLISSLYRAQIFSALHTYSFLYFFQAHNNAFRQYVTAIFFNEICNMYQCLQKII